MASMAIWVQLAVVVGVVIVAIVVAYRIVQMLRGLRSVNAEDTRPRDEAETGADAGVAIVPPKMAEAELIAIVVNPDDSQAAVLSSVRSDVAVSK